MTFTLNEEQKEKFEKWKAERNAQKYSGAIGGRWTFSFTPTSIGCIVKAQDAMGDKQEIDLTDYESW